MLSSQPRFSVSSLRNAPKVEVGSVLVPQKDFVPTKRLGKDASSRKASKLARGGGGTRRKTLWRVAKIRKHADTLRMSERSPWCLLPIVYPRENKIIQFLWRLHSQWFVISHGQTHRSWRVFFTWIQHHLFLAQMEYLYLVLAFSLSEISKFCEQV